MANAAIRLEQILRMHEDNCFSVEMMQRAYSVQKIPMMAEVARMWEMIKHAPQLRKDLAEIKLETSWQEVGDYLSGHRVHHRPEHEIFDLRLLAMWVSHSRRMFKLSSDLQTLLGATALDGVSWGDVHFPFDGFAISLAQTIHVELDEQKIEYDTIVLARDSQVGDNHRPYVFFMLLPTLLDSLPFFSAGTRRRIVESGRRQDWKKVKKKTQAYLEYGSVISQMVVYGRVRRDMTVTQNLSIFANQTNLKSDVLPRHALRIIAGMCLYLKSLPSPSTHVTPWVRDEESVPTDRGQCITDETEVCQVSTQFKLSSREREVYERNMDEVMSAPAHTISPHFRRGFWRRPRGLGQDPAAPRTEWVRPTVVNEHLLQEGELPKGAATILLT